MADIKKLLELRKKVKSKKPFYIRQTGWKKAKLEKKWIRPRGEQSKLRERKRGHGHRPEPGYGSPKEVRGFTREGLKPILVKNINDLKLVTDKKLMGILLSGALGDKKKIEIVAEAKKLGLIMINMKDPEAYAKKVQEKMTKRKDARKSKITAKSEKEKKAQKKSDEKKKSEAPKESSEEKKKAEKDEKDKVLTEKE